MQFIQHEKINTYRFLIRMLIPSVAQNNKKAYDYPVRRGHAAWDTLKTFDQRRAATQVSAKFIKESNTSVLLESILKYPLLGELFFYNSFQTGIARLRTTCTALDSLMKRKDMCETVLDTYRAIDIRLVDSLPSLGFSKIIAGRKGIPCWTTQTISSFRNANEQRKFRFPFINGE